MIRSSLKRAVPQLLCLLRLIIALTAGASIIFTARIASLFRHAAPTPAMGLIVINCPIGSRNDLPAPFA